MLIESIGFAFIGLAVGIGALLLLPEFFPGARGLTVATALVTALLGGWITHYALGGRLPGVSLGVSAIASVLLVSVLARPDRAAGRSRGRHRHA
ncbi:hypothetical protein GCM10009760_05140 [Kitasatospora kazusensis]|uniref:Integral membrane protein n=1 Tax=Kitasatospora kazusensis TaxID=407974 RepID=A0ABN2YRN0_9ACTN